MKATIHKGIINVPVKLTPTTKESYYTSGLNQFCMKCGGRVRQKKFCEKEGRELSNDEITKGFVIDKKSETAVMFTKEELGNMESEDNYMIELYDFKQLSDKQMISFLIFARKSYYVDADNKKVESIFEMFKCAIEQENSVALVKLTNRSKEHLGYMFVFSEVLYFVEIPFSESINSFEARKYKVNEKDVGYAREFIKANLGETDVSQIENKQKAKMNEIIARKMRGEAITFEADVGKIETESNPFQMALKNEGA